ncbi:AraC family transcriptional regulator ligand-binding domain-containing protein [Sphingobium sp. DEHP117]|uniref:AraC family transcriptional regulator ligand-binding domain-containing protein n=1 Tax=Sphingobium sp. DEHP117 TaxID=2993436 RepID=UPI0027D5CDD9|nr:AraC family transcriptional regulator ligand-binding domain-containing protein [Sphingobium sp. DEHP117]MDQ4420991.1 AraC family transcriptional regulator ligand-binding domain-containing protein [Sphingobium sp. DEHP117]
MGRAAGIVKIEKDHASVQSSNLFMRKRTTAVRSLPFGWAGKSAALAAARGAPILELLRAAGVGDSEQCIADGDALSAAHYMLMGVGTINLVDDELHAVSRTKMPRGTVSTGLRIMASARSLRTAIESLTKFYALIGQNQKIELGISGSTTRLELSADISDSRYSAAIEEMIIISLHCQFSFILDRFLPVCGIVTHGDHPATNLTHPYLGCKVLRGPKTALIFPTSCLDLQPIAKIGDTPVTDAVLYWLKQIETQGFSRIGCQTLKPISAAVFERLRVRDVSYGECCLELGFTGDELRRALCAEGTGYRSLRHSALLERLRPYLASRANMDDVALDMGFSDARSLRRSLRSASGMSLTELKASIDLVTSCRDPSLIGHLKHQLNAME